MGKALSCEQKSGTATGGKKGEPTNCIQYVPTQTFNLALKDDFRKMVPKYDPKPSSRSSLAPTAYPAARRPRAV